MTGFPTLKTAVLLLLILGLYLKAQPLLLMAALLALTALAAGFWGRHALDRVSCRRSLDRARCFAGEAVTLTVELTNRKPLPVPVLTVDELVPEDLAVKGVRLSASGSPGKGIMRLQLALAWYQRVVRRYTLTAAQRGYYQIGPASLSASDPFGWARSGMEVPEQLSLLVYPKVLPLERFGLPSRRPFGDLRSRDPLFEDPLAAAGVRPYHPGDPLNRIHWKSTASTGRLQVRKLDPSAQPGMAVLLNTWAFAHHWEGPDPHALELGCSLAASIGAWAAGQRLPVGLYANALVAGWGFSLHLPPAGGQEAVQRMLEGLARLTMPSRQSPAELLAAASAKLAYGTSLVYITPRVDEQLAGLLWKEARSGRPVTLILVGQPDELPQAIPGVRTYLVPEEEAVQHAILA